MGLTMIAYAAPAPAIANPLDVSIDEDAGFVQLHRWRNHYPLHNYLVNLLAEKRGNTSNDAEFTPFVLTLQDLDDMEGSIVVGFWDWIDQGPPPHDDIAYDMQFLGDARAAIHAGQVIVYDAG